MNSPKLEVEKRFNALLDEFGSLLRRTIVNLCPRDLGVQFDDIEQDARLRVWRALQGESEITNVASYLYRVAATATIDALRRVHARHEEQLQTSSDSHTNEEGIRVQAPPMDSPERVAESREVVRKVMAALAQLSDDRRRAVGMYLEGMGSQDIADVLHWTEPRARNLLYRGLKDLRTVLRAEGIDYEIE